MNRIPNCLVVIDPSKEKNAIREAGKLGVTTVALIDTNCDPDAVDLPIPGNDDGIRSIDLILTGLAEAVIEGSSIAAAHQKAQQAEAASAAEAKAAATGDKPEPGEQPAAVAAPEQPAESEEVSAEPVASQANASDGN
jgi:small subunit ribosomal protein S2